MSAPVTYVKTEVPYPVFEAEFDPYNRGYLLVAGGGGENNAGVPNRLTLLDTASKHTIDHVAEIDLSTKEDSVQSLANLGTREGLISFAGINSSEAELKQGRNDHFRVFTTKFPERKKNRSEDTEPSKGKIELVTKASIFGPVRDSKQQPYQRLCKLSPVGKRESGIKRLGAIATAWAPENEIVIFDATSVPPDKSSIVEKIKIKGGAEAEDLDIGEHSDGWFAVVYCTQYEVFVDRLHYDFLAKKTQRTFPEPPCVYTVPKGDTASRPKLRSLRWISPNHVLLLQNLPGNKGAELLVLRIHPPTANPGVITLHKKLPFSQAVNRGLAVCLLDQDNATFERQIVVAVAGTDRSVVIYTENYDTTNKNPLKQISNLSKFTSFDNVHPNAIGKLTFSNFFPPQQPSDSVTSVATAQQHIQLASISVANTVVVETLALTSIPASPSTTAAEAQSDSKRKAPAVRYVLSSGDNVLRSWPGLVAIAIMVVAASMLLQLYLNPQTPILTPIFDLLSKDSSHTPVKPAVSYTATVSPVSVAPSPDPLGTADTSGTLRSLLAAAADRKRAGAAAGKVEDPEIEYEPSPILVRPHPDHPIEGVNPTDPSRPQLPEDFDPLDPKFDAEFERAPLPDKIMATQHEDAVDLRLSVGKASRFEELPHDKKEYWKNALKKAGQWFEHEGEGVLTGVFFAEVADVVGGAIRDAAMG